MEEQQAYTTHVGQQFTSSEDFARSLCNVNSESVNLVHLIMWVWKHIATRRSTGCHKLPLGSSSYHSGLTAAAQTKGLNPMVLQWCIDRKLSSPRDTKILAALGFSIRDDIMDLTDNEWDKVGVRPLEKWCLIAVSEEDKKHSGVKK